MMDNAIGPYPLDCIITGDARESAEAIPDASIDLIFTDPPYQRKYAYTFSDLASFAGRVLKDGGRLLTLLGQYQLYDVMTVLNTSLTYDWIIADAAFGKQAALFQKRVWACWKPCLVYRKGTITHRSNFALDMFAEKPSQMTYAKTFHEWGQGAGFFAYYIDRWTLPGDIILDPFVGGGTVPAVCKILERHYLAFEIDPATADKARERVANTLPLLDNGAEWITEAQLPL